MCPHTQQHLRATTAFSQVSSRSPASLKAVPLERYSAASLGKPCGPLLTGTPWQGLPIHLLPVGKASQVAHLQPFEGQDLIQGGKENKITMNPKPQKKYII